MPRYLSLYLMAFILITLPIDCTLNQRVPTAHDEAVNNEIIYVFSKDGGHELFNSSISPYSGSDKIIYSTGGPGMPSLRDDGTTVDKIKNDINKRIIVGNQIVKSRADELAMSYPGAFNIGQVCAIYSYVRNNWSYVSDPVGEDYYKYPNETLQLKSIGGDCDDFAILMSSLIDAIGGTTRIMLAYGPNGGHAYTEVYLGKMGSNDQNVEKLTKWVETRYDLNEINTHKNLISNDVWLNLDWSANSPGGSFDPAPKQVPILLRDQFPMASPSPSPLAVFSIIPDKSNEGLSITFDASRSCEMDDLKKLDWDFGDGTKDSGQIAVHTYARADNYTVTLKVSDSNGATSTKSSIIKVDAFPEHVISSDTKSWPIDITKSATMDVSNPVVVSLTPDKNSPQSAGTTITWTALSSGGNPENTYYQFLLKGPSTSGEYEDVTSNPEYRDMKNGAWSKNNRWIWKTSDEDIGINEIVVKVIDSAKASYTEAANAKSEKFEIEI